MAMGGGTTVASKIAKIGKNLKLCTSVLPTLKRQRLRYESLMLFGGGKPANENDCVTFPETKRLVFKDCTSFTVASWTTKKRFPNLEEVYLKQPPRNGYALPYMNRLQKVDEDDLLHTVFDVPVQDGVTINVVDFPHDVTPIGDVNVISQSDFDEVVHEFSTGDLIAKRNNVIIGKFDDNILEFNDYHNLPHGINPAFNWTEFKLELEEENKETK